jgi:hypothetical protein
MNDPDIIDEPMYLREIHAIRFMIQDQTKNMTFEERKAYYHERTKATFAEYGFTPKYVNPYNINETISAE